MLMKRTVAMALCALMVCALCLTALPKTALADASLSVADGSVYLRSESGNLQYSRDNSAWTTYTGTITLTGSTTAASNTTIDVQSGTHSVTFNGVYITSGQPMHIAKGATVDLQLEADSTNTLTATGAGKAALHVPADIDRGEGTMGTHATLTIGGSGSLTANGSNIFVSGGAPYKYGAGIGGNGARPAEGCGKITINGGTIYANGGGPPADNDNDVATGAGIGSGGSDTKAQGSQVNQCTFGGDITITNGTVIAVGGSAASSSSNVFAGAGIGGGGVANDAELYHCQYNISIEGGMVTATGGNAQIQNNTAPKEVLYTCAGNGIGGGGCSSFESATAGSIAISGGTVVATGGKSGADDTSTCARAHGSAGIGSPYPDSGSDAGSITITGGDVTAVGGEVRGNHLGSGAGIGTPGFHESHETKLQIDISGGSVTATGGRAVNTLADSGTGYRVGTGAGIGSGSGIGFNSSTSNIRISGGTIHATSPAPEDASGQTDPAKKPKCRQGAGVGTGGRQAGDFGAPTFTTSGGSIWAEGYTDASRTPNGGSMGSGQEHNSCPAANIANASGTPVYLTTLTLDGVGTGIAVTALDALLGGSAYGYGLNDVKTLDGGKLYAYLPASTETKSATAGAAVYYPKLTAADPWPAQTSAAYGSFTAKTLYTGTPVTGATLAISPEGTPYRLSVSDVVPTGAAVGYQWQRKTGGAWENISGAADAAYAPGAGDHGATLRAIVYGTGSYASCVVLDGGAAFEPPVITTDTALPDGMEDASYDQRLVATGAPDIQWALSDGTLPMGLTVESDGQLHGTPGAAGDYSFTLKASNRFGAVTRQFTLTVITAPAYGVSLTPSLKYTFPDAVLGYGAQTPKSVVAANVGTRPTGPLALSLSGADAGDFTLSTNALPALATGASSSFTVVPATGLAAGEHTATVTLSGDNGIRQTLDLSFTVNALPVPPASGGAPSISGGSADTGNAYGGSFTEGANGALVLTVQAPCEKCVSVMVDGMQLKKDMDYIVECGSTVITFTPAYLATLKDGAHAIRVQFTDGRYDGSFTTPFAAAVMTMPMADVPATGDAPLLAKLLKGLGKIA